MSEVNRDADIRSFFPRKRRISSQKSENKLLIDKKVHCNDALSNTIIIPRQPLYTSPPKLGDLALSKDNHNGDEDKVRDITYFLGLKGDSFQEMLSLEMDRLKIFLSKVGISWTVNFEDPLAFKLLRNLLESDLQRNPGEYDRIPLLLSSTSFMKGIEILVELLRNHEKGEDMTAQDSWNLLMVIEASLRAQPMIWSNEQVTNWLRDQERLILIYNIWQSEFPIYELLYQESFNLTSRRRKDHESSPGKALKSMTSSSLEVKKITGLEFFFRKLLRLAAGIIEYLITALNLGTEERMASWKLFMEGIENELELRLLFRHHLLTIIACTVYSVAKLMDKTRPFAQIINVLQRQYSYFKEGWFREIPVADEIVDMVKFYNGYYLERMKERIYALHKVPRTPERPNREHLVSPSTPFPRVFGNVALSRNITLNVSPGQLNRHMTPNKLSASLDILGNLGTRRTERAPPTISKPKGPARRLDF